MQPMFATSSTLPEGDGWAFEFTWDGLRVLLDASPEGVTITGPSGNDIAREYPEIVAQFSATGTPDVLLDGELVAFDEAGRSSFELLGRRMHARSGAQARELAASTPVSFLVCDVLRLYGVGLLDRTYEQRRATLERVAADHPDWVVSPSFDDGQATAAAARANGLAGVVAKRRASLYRPGMRSSDWVKAKFPRRQEFEVRPEAGAQSSAGYAIAAGGGEPGRGGTENGQTDDLEG